MTDPTLRGEPRGQQPPGARHARPLEPDKLALDQGWAGARGDRDELRPLGVNVSETEGVRFAVGDRDLLIES